MKKLMIMAAVACLAVASQAAVAVTWNTGTFNAPNADGSISGTPVANNTAATVYWATITFATDAAMQNVVALSSGGTTTAKYATKNSVGLSAKTGADFDTSAVGGNTYYAQVVLHALVNGDPKVEQTMTSDIGAFSFTEGTLSGKTINFTTGNNIGGANLFAGKTWTAAVPEPTSGLLMLVGLGALALRRRRA